MHGVRLAVDLSPSGTSPRAERVLRRGTDLLPPRARRCATPAVRRIVTQMFETDERARLAAILDEQVPGASALGAVEYVERLLTALDHDPPRIWAAPGGWS